MKLIRYIYLLIALAIILTGCSSLSRTPMSQGHEHPRPEYSRQDYLVLDCNSTSPYKEIRVPKLWKGRRIFFIEKSEIGDRWIENEVTESIIPGKVNTIQTYADRAYLEARGYIYIQNLSFTPDIDNEKVSVEITLDSMPRHGTNVALTYKNGEYLTVSVPTEEKTTTLEVQMPRQDIWSKDVPYLFKVTAIVGFGRRTIDAVDSYFIMK